VCHECAHTFFPGFSYQPRYRCSPMTAAVSDRELESLCDLAASELLLPERLFAPLARDNPLAITTVEYLADEFDASLIATATRLIKGRPEPSALLTFEFRQAPREIGTDAPPKLRLQTSVTSGPWPSFRRHTR